MLGRTRRIHFVGIGGIGMSGIAELLANLGYEVTGSDARGSDVTRRLAHSAWACSWGTTPRTSAPRTWSSCRRRSVRRTRRSSRRGAARIPVIPRAEMLAELMRLRYGIAIAGAHGKTTTTSMVALVLERAGLDPTAVIGGRLSAFGSNARLGRGESMVVEADESDRSFLKLSPAIALVTNIDREHMEAYGSWEALTARVPRVRQQGAVLRCRDPVHRRRRGAGAAAARDPARHHLRPCRRVAPRRRRTRHAARAVRRALHRHPAVDGRDVELGRAAAAGARPAQPAQRARRRRGRPRAPGPLPPHRGGARGIQRRRAALPGARRAPRRDGRRRLRPSSDRDRRGDRRGALDGAAAAGRVPAAPLHAHARPAARSSARRSAPPTRSC